MLIGRPLRKQISQLVAYGIYRWVAVWVLIALCASYGEVGLVVALGIVAISICIAGSVKGISMMLQAQSNKDWLDRLTNRMFYRLFWEALKSEDRAYIDIDQLFNEAGEKAVADIKIADDYSQGFGFFDKTAWHWFGGILHFIALIIGDVVYYGSAIWVGTNMLRSPF